MLGDTKFWTRYIVVFVLVAFFVTGLLELAEWVAKLVKHPVVLCVRITKSESRDLRAAAKRAGLTVREYARKILCEV